MKLIKSYILQKLTATIVVTTIFSFLFAFNYTSRGNFRFDYNHGNQFIGGFFFYAIYVGAIVLLYGNLVSIVVERLQSKWFIQQTWLYIVILGTFGSAIGLFFQSGRAAVLGILAAIVYGLIEKWVEKRTTKNKRIKWFFLIPVFFLFIYWGYLQIISPPKPPFTKQDAVQSVTDSRGTVIERFPEEIGRWEGDVEGYQVTRETDVKEISNEVYMVTLVESWKEGNDKGMSTWSYRVNRRSLVNKGREGEIPPYYE
ncbi:hypothetical protein Pryu01_01841 [Paraliobacillus ryukyuensis]|uniref:Uncharacterized protein n=1 Tax=Paraliobacillus ryukyuensis TaxID=200904 RepID=A0A366DSY1_9BACI|nr:hypothetical protein [Paraliobacillus ryukyuensis]RBO93193.1 hypothetical protein DES48_11359 [Paraliobacillus ryukyuensis]